MVMCLNTNNMPNTAKRKKLLPSLKLLLISSRLAWRNLTNLMYLVILPNLLLSLGQLYSNQAQTRTDADKMIGFLMISSGLVWLLINQTPIIYFAIKSAQGFSLTLTECYREGLRFFWRYLLLVLGLVVVVGLGLVLFIIPGLLAAYFILQRYYLSPYFMIDQNLSIKAALVKSSEQTKSYFLNIIDVIFLQITLVLTAALVGLSSIIVGIGLSTLVATITVFVLALRYQEITARLPLSVSAK